MEHFNGDLGAEFRYRNEMMEHMRKQTALLEQIAQLLKADKVVKPVPKKTTPKSKGGG